MSHPTINANSVPPSAADASDDDLVDVTFGTKEEEARNGTILDSTDDSSNATRAARRNSSFTSRHHLLILHSSEIFHSTLKIFQRTNGNNGASVSTLRGTVGADFEGRGLITASNSLFDYSSLLQCCGGMMMKKDKERFLLIKGYHCFIFDNEDSMSPKYAIELMNRKAFIGTLSIFPSTFAAKQPNAPRKDTTYATVHLETSMGDVDYKITFSDSIHASKFCGAVMNASTNATYHTQGIRRDSYRS